MDSNLAKPRATGHINSQFWSHYNKVVSSQQVKESRKNVLPTAQVLTRRARNGSRGSCSYHAFSKNNKGHGINNSNEATLSQSIISWDFSLSVRGGWLLCVPKWLDIEVGHNIAMPYEVRISNPSDNRSNGGAARNKQSREPSQ